MKQVKWVIAILMIAVLPLGVALAQETSSSINGTIVDSDGNAISGATVIVTHEPTGQVKTLTTNDEGRYSARGLRTGGPYNIEVRNSGYSDAEEGNIFIKLGEDRAIDAVLVADAISLDTVTAVGVAAQSLTFNPDNMGAGTSVSQEQITNLPTVDRDIQDFVRLDSRVNLRSFGNGISVSGVNNRFNNISIDGVGIGDPFGLEAGGSPGLSQPFSLDTIEELNVQLSPYDVTLSNFTGANINAITKSGTNEFSGRAAMYYSSEDLQRDDSDFTREVYSISAGGPIIKDKLFFFLAYENEEQTRLANTSSVDVALAQQVAAIAANTYGVDVGNLNAPTDLVTEEESIVVKLDWNINEFHRASFKYQNNEDAQPTFANNGGGEISLSSHWYTNSFENKSYNLNLYSDWTANFSTELRVSNSEFDKVPQLNSILPHVEVEVGDGDSVFFGTEEFRHANELNVVTDNIYLEGNYFMGDHNLTFGVDWREQDIRNLFISQALGYYEFASIDDFANGIHSRYEYNRGTNEPRPEANWSWENLGLFIQDNWAVNDRLTVQYGLRWDKPNAGDKPRFNQDFFDFYGFANNNVVDEGTFQPRIGFNYDMSDERYMQLRGGVGVFTGGTPNVWLSNSFTNTGGDLTFYSSNGVDQDGVIFTLDPNNQPILDGSSRQNVDVLDPDFKIPTVLKSNLAVDAELPWFGLVGSVELEYIKAQDAIDYQHLNLGDPTGTLPDGRLAYWSDIENLSGRRGNANPDFNDVIYLTNTSKGETKRATVSLELPQTEHWYAKASYTFTDATETSAGTSSRAISNWNNTPAFNPNQALAATSAYEVENAFVFTTTYQNMFFGDNYTNIGLVWISQDGEPFSHTYSNDVNGDGIRDNDLVYVPLPGEYVLSDPSEAAEFETFLRTSGLAQYRGRVAPRNAFKAPRINTVDLNVSQELPAWGPVRATLFFNIKNLGNMIDSDWGQIITAGFDGNDVYRLNSIEDGIYELDWNGPTRFSTNRTASQWRAQVGFRLDW
ncbi:TonB-dependent receptor [Marinicella sp. S1101]|uniref:TonB-dependent receptor n=1 Tax=Marinicella marina TaxID=2996016 RepID=UPI002260E76F|nr:carboxypeptidase regulatory-like domain-containing protein [Marinicella marina]MCX7552844.1 TonB-dependent receptor [Marinicella marina]MDJ1139847.1 TonB-dependent receptor [Marinicella marina]